MINGVLALFGIACAHLATNLFDDYLDYNALDNNCQKCKCLYIKEGKASVQDVLRVVITYLSIAFIIGFVLFVRCGFFVVILACLGGFIALFYQKFSKVGLSEVAVGIAFGPLFFEGVYYVMKGKFSYDVLILSLAVVMFTIGLMYVHTVLDYEGDMSVCKKTLVCRLKNKKCAINGVYLVYGLGFLFTGIFALKVQNYYLFFTFLLLPLIVDLHKNLKNFQCGDDVSQFYFRLLKARNIMVYFCLLVVLAFISEYLTF